MKQLRHTTLLWVAIFALLAVAPTAHAARKTKIKPAETKEYYMAKCEAEWDCREKCCTEYRQCLHQQMQGKKGKMNLANAIKACKAERVRCFECKRACKKEWKRKYKLAHAAPETQEATEPTPVATETTAPEEKPAHRKTKHKKASRKKARVKKTEPA